MGKNASWILMFSLEQQKLPKTYLTTYSHGAKHILRYGAHIHHFQSKHLPIYLNEL